MNNSDFQIEGRFKSMEAINGERLHWSDFRSIVLQPFRIICSNSPKSEHIPTTFLAQLRSFQGDFSKYEDQRRLWRLHVAANKGVGISPIFPPSLIPMPPSSGVISRCMLPKLNREALPLRNASAKPPLYELPTAKPVYICGFDSDTFDEAERCHLAGPLKVTGTTVDFTTGDVSTSKSICCPFLTFEKFTTSAQQDIETARNHCAVIGAQNLRGQQQLFHKAYGLKTVSQPPITFTCAVNNDQSVINFHCVDGEGNYTMVALCRFSLDEDHHFNNFQAWIEAIENWAFLYLLPRIKGALTQASRNSQTPPPSPLTSFSSLSIDTSSDSVVLTALRRYWPEIAWRHEGIGETPINSSIAQCGTPMPTRNLYSQLLPRPSSSSSLGSAAPIDTTRTSSPKHPLAVLSPLQTDLSLPQRISTSRPLSAVSSLSRDFFDGRSTSPASPCRPSSLSPSTPGPEAPVSSKSPMLVMQRRLEIAMNEIQEMRGQMEEMQRTFNYKTDRLERRLEMALDSKQVTPTAATPRRSSDLSPTHELLFFTHEEEKEESCDDQTSLPGTFPELAQGETIDLLRDLYSWYRIIVQTPTLVQWLLLLLCVWLCSVGAVDLGDMVANIALTVLGTISPEVHLDSGCSREDLDENPAA